MTDVPDLDRFHREAVEEARQQIIANRWAAFTDAELKELLGVDEFVDSPGRSFIRHPLWQEIRAELERRRS